MSPIDIQDVMERAKGSVRVGDHEEAERLLKTYISKMPDSREARLLMGTTLARKGRLSEAADEFNTLLVKNPRDIEALNNIAVIYRRQGKFQEALDSLVEAIDIDPTKAEFHYNVGNIHKQMGNLKAASMAYAKVIELDPNYAPAYNNLGTIYDQLKEYDKAYGVFRKGLALDNNNPTLHFNYGVALEANGRLEDASKEYRSALRSKPGWLEPMNNLGIVNLKQGHHDKALDIFNRILDTDPFNAEARNNIGVVQADQGRTKEAIQNYRRAIEADPKYTKAVVNLERVLEDSGDFADAVVELEKLIKLTPDSAEVRNRLAGLYLKMERYPEALEQAKAALEWEPENIAALRVMGAVQRVTGGDEEAKATFEKILSIDPGNYTFQLDLADIHFRRKEYKEAEDRILTYLARRPNDRAAKLLLGKLYAEMGNRTHAIQIFEELARTDPNDTEALAAAAELHRAAGSFEKALRTADTLVNLQGKRATSDDLSDLNKSLEFYESAVNAYSSSVKEMWDKNMKLLSSAEEAAGEEEAGIDLLLGSAGMTQVVDEETEALFIEDDEAFGEDEIVNEDFFPEEPYSELPEPMESPASLDDLAEPPAMQAPPPSAPPQAAPQERPSPAAPPQAAPREAPAQQPPPPARPYPPPPRYPAPPPPRPQSYQPPPPPPMPQPYQPPPSPRPEPPRPELPKPELPPWEESPPEPPEPELPPWEESPPEPPAEEDMTPDNFLMDEAAEEEAAEEEAAEEEAAEEEETPEDEVIFPGDPALELSPDEEDSVFTDEVPEDLSGQETEDGVLDVGSEFEIPEEESAEEEEEIFAEEDTAVEEEFVVEEEAVPVEEDTAVEEEPFPEEEPAVEEAPSEEELVPPPPAGAEGIESEAVDSPQDGPGKPIEASGVVELLNCLKELTRDLPDKERENFLHSDVRLSMEFVIDVLRGQKGLFKEIEERRGETIEDVESDTNGPPPGEVAGALSYLEQLAAALPDRELSETITRKVETVITGIKQSGGTKQSAGSFAGSSAEKG